MTNVDICIYHANCFDGFTSAWAVRLVHPDAVFIPARYGAKGLPAGLDVVGADVVLVDFTYSHELTVELCELAKSVTILDHHLTAQNVLEPLLDNGTVQGEFDMDRSGARIAWEWFHEEEDVPLLVQYVEDRDLWKHELLLSNEVCAFIHSHDFVWDIWDNLHHELEEDPETLVRYSEHGRILIQQRDKDINILLKQVRYVVVDGFKVPMVNCPPYLSSDTGNRLCEGRPFSVTYFDSGSSRVYSLRSTVDVGEDVSLIASKLGGGGHKHAAGFKRPLPPLKEIL